MTSSYRPFSASATPTSSSKRNTELNSRERSWEGRAWISSHRELLHTTDLPKIRVISYRLNADFKNIFLNYSSHKAWETKQQLLLHEITCYEADILCLQDIDHYEDFWFPTLSKLGYDVIYKQRTQEKDYHPEGILVAYSRERFSLVKSVILELNQSSSSAAGVASVSVSSDLSSRPIQKTEEISSAFAEKCRTDDIAVMLFIKSYYSNDLPCNGLCIGNILLDELSSNSDVRLFHCKYFIQKIEKENKDFQFPIILGMNINDIPYSLPYVFMKTGRKPLTASIPSACSQGKPVVLLFCFCL
jgi:mRNA deadenylase 3'-5' endonuclease subunit Ccr4